MRNSRRVMLQLSLGILCGLILILLPAALLPGPTNSPTTNTCSSYCYGPSSLANRYPPVAGPATLGSSYPGASILGILFLILLPSLVFSVLVRRWARTRTGGRATFE
ncbi:hypothetical protein E6H23_11335 [Candidatus Bathyarchaeota archaeon]|nr:MAG: hypothetical protein E6H23_11335 [Candidatus Bathyarchaeota archaeon]